MATGLDQTYPAQHQSLRQQIIEHGGAVISEFLPGPFLSGQLSPLELSDLSEPHKPL